MIRVVKVDGSLETFDHLKLTAAFWKVLAPAGQGYDRARYLADAVWFFLSRSHLRQATTGAIFEMAMKVLHNAGLNCSAQAMAAYRTRRQGRRVLVRVRHDEHLTAWDKSWLSGVAQQYWCLSSTTARIIAGQIEHDLLQMNESDTSDTTRPRELSRLYLIDMLNTRVAQLGLADTVPV